jgi:pimeloyl-ACP methyl ester carboxylesterase
MYVEELYFWAGAPGVRRGYNVLLVELPRGGSPPDGPHYMAETGAAMAAALDYALKRPDVDPERVSVFGVDSGAYAAARVAALDGRVRACVLNPPVLNPHTAMTESSMPPAETADSGGSAFVGGGFQTLPYVLPASSIVAVEEPASAPGRLDALVDRIACPVLCLAGEGEPVEVMAEALEFYGALAAPGEMRIYGPEDGSSAHCLADNFGLLHQTMFDWLDEIN